METSVRTATAADVAAIAAVYDHEVATGIATFDLDPPPSSTWEDKIADQGPGLPVLVATVDGEVAGYAYAAAYRPRRAYDRTREVSVYLTGSAQGRGLGRALYDVLLDRLRTDGIHTAVAVVAQPNPASEALHRACGFTRVGLLPEVGWKQERWVDVAFWALVL